MAPASRHWVFEPAPAKLAVELLTARLVDRREHVVAGLTALRDNGPEALFETGYAWAIGVAVVNNPTSTSLASTNRMRWPTELTITPDTVHGRELGSAYVALVIAAANAQRAAAWEMWQSLTTDEMGYILANLLENYVKGLDRHRNRRRPDGGNG